MSTVNPRPTRPDSDSVAHSSPVLLEWGGAGDYSGLVPWGLKRFQQSGQTHFVTFCCYHRRPLFLANAPKRTFEAALERVRRSFGLCVYGYVIMPEHVHLLISEPQRDTLAVAIKSLKQGVARRLIGDAAHFWQKRYYDRKVQNYPELVEKLRYIHRNPVKSGLCERAEDWDWSSFRHYASGLEGRVEIESEWTARRRERAAGRLCPARELAGPGDRLVSMAQELFTEPRSA